MVREVSPRRSFSLRLSAKALTSLAGEIGRFGLVGGIQLGVDWALFVVLSWAGIGVVPSNLIARAGGAGFGYWLNGKYTFASGSGLGRKQMIRFVVTWIVLSVLSSTIVWIVGDKAGLGWAWLVKPAGDAALALLSFFISKHWIYR
ncbi:GtrA family protein [Stenotrophomonas sp. CFBP8994]|uniref:GtrA family protein n=1 Tax=Stenotrophomonas sp. CFBP8994 TaxID=3096527 RepID=UPI002A6ADF35|nr:GtrA family protein [Stenotrophomonas sp. CFBP8994]MDY0980250.1 GtrA family protein [Stenotrophomonas sp. CFBP8994]